MQEGVGEVKTTVPIHINKMTSFRLLRLLWNFKLSKSARGRDGRSVKTKVINRRWKESFATRSIRLMTLLKLWHFSNDSGTELRAPVLQFFIIASYSSSILELPPSFFIISTFLSRSLHIIDCQCKFIDQFRSRQDPTQKKERCIKHLAPFLSTFVVLNGQ